MSQTSDNYKNIYLIGFMGTGKSAVSRGLANRLGYTRIDVDEGIVAQEGQSVAAIFAEKGEAHFRALERTFIDHGHPEQGVVVSCGGGLPVQPGMFEQLEARGDVVALLAEPETIFARIRADTTRPLLTDKNSLQTIRTLLNERRDVYQSAKFQVWTDGLSVEAVVDAVCERLGRL